MCTDYMDMLPTYVNLLQTSFVSRYSSNSNRHLTCTRRQLTNGTTGLQANALEDSKRRAKSAWDNIPDLNERYIYELQEIERKYGPKTLKKDVAKERGKSILAPPASSVRAARKREILRPEYTVARESKESLEGYQRLRFKLLSDTAFLGTLGCCVVWSIGTLKAVGSYGLGVGASLVYLTLLSRSVDRLADAAKNEQGGADGLKPARIALLCLMFVAVGKNRQNFDILPVVMGFLTYKVATIIPLITGEAFED